MDRLTQLVRKGADQLTIHFGFDGFSDFYNSIIHQNLLTITLPLAAVSGLLEGFLGIKFFTLISFLTLTLLELVTGIVLSKKEKRKITSRRFSRFGLKLLVWLVLVGISNVFRLQYKSLDGVSNVLAQHLFTWLHTSVFVYITLEYFISVGENLSKITGKDLTIFQKIKNKVEFLFGIDKKENNDGTRDKK